MPKQTLATTTYDRDAALAYARTYWERIATDGCVCVDGWPSWKALPPDTTFRHFVKSGEEGEEAVGPDGTVRIGWDVLEDCTHFLSCCLGTPPGETPGGGLDVPQEVPVSAENPSPPYGCVGAPTLVDWLLSTPSVAQVLAAQSTDRKYIDQLSPGDFIAYHDGHGYHHTALYLGKGVIACHTVCRSDAKTCTWSNQWDLGVGYNTWTFIRMLDAPSKTALAARFTAEDAAASTSSATRLIQAELCEWGADNRAMLDPPDYASPHDVDGVLGPRTARAVSSFQKADGLPVTGTCDTATGTALRGFIDRRARGAVSSAWPLSTSAVAAAFQGAQAVARLETVYGLAWSKAGIGSHNWGAVQCCVPTTNADGSESCPASSFLYTDTHPNPDGTSSTYSVCFRAYADDVAGATDFLSVLLVNRPAVAAVIASGSASQIATAMYETKYFEGYGKTPAERIAHYAAAIAANAAAIATANGEPVLVT